MTAKKQVRFELTGGPDPQRAEEIADFLNENLPALSSTDEGLSATVLEETGELVVPPRHQDLLEAVEAHLKAIAPDDPDA